MVFGKGNFANLPKELVVKWAKLGGATSKARSEENRRLYYLNPKRCKQCGKIIPYEKKGTSTFCDHTCAAIYNNLNCSKNPDGHKHRYDYSKHEKKCSYCGKIIRRSGIMKKENNVFCCRDHQWLYDIEERIKKKQYVKPQTLRKYLIKTRGYKCENKNCGLSEWMGQPIPLDCHHKDGDITNNELSNLELLCKNCHGITDNYGIKNKGCSKRTSYYTKRCVGGKFVKYSYKKVGSIKPNDGKGDQTIESSVRGDV